MKKSREKCSTLGMKITNRKGKKKTLKKLEDATQTNVYVSQALFSIVPPARPEPTKTTAAANSPEASSAPPGDRKPLVPYAFSDAATATKRTSTFSDADQLPSLCPATSAILCRLPCHLQLPDSIKRSPGPPDREGRQLCGGSTPNPHSCPAQPRCR